MSKHRAQPRRTPPEWRWRLIKNRWYGFIKPDLKRRYRALQSLTEQSVGNLIKK